MEQFATAARQGRVNTLKPILAALAEGQKLSRETTREAFALILRGGATPAQLGAFLMALRQRGETPEELIGAARAMRASMIAVEAPRDAIDIVGTGGDGANTYNISTLAAIIVAGCGVPVAKHGGKAASSLSGATDVLAELGVKVGLDAASASACLRDVGICFMAAPTHHPALRHAAPVRSELGLRTIFNLIGPLCNPAGVTRQVLGVYSREWLEPLAMALRELGCQSAWLLHGSDGLDEATTTGATHVVALEGDALRSFEIGPEQAGLRLVNPEELTGGDPAHNAHALREVLAGARNAYRDIAVLNAGIALMVADKTRDLREAAAMAAASLDSGAAREKLELLARVSNQQGR